MARVYEISKEDKKDWIFKDSRGMFNTPNYISYRNVVSRALHCKVKEDAECKKLFDDLYNSWTQDENFQPSGEFLQLYFSGKEKEIVFLIDDTEGCFPLMFMGERRKALGKVLENIKTQWENIFKIIKENKENDWSPEIERALEEFYDKPPEYN